MFSEDKGVNICSGESGNGMVWCFERGLRRVEILGGDVG
jgi:hypothetical protein